jgi:predicted Rossmann-fold nucleotide-binding protein
MVNHGVISQEDLDLFKFLDTPEDAFEYLKQFLTREYKASLRPKRRR